MYDFSKKKDIAANKLIWSDKRCILGFKKSTLAFHFYFPFLVALLQHTFFSLENWIHRI